MEIVRSVNRSWIYDSHFSLYKPIHQGGNVRGIVRIPYLCMHVCICMCVCMFVFICVYIYVSMYFCMYVFKCMLVHMYMHECVCMYVYYVYMNQLNTYV